MLVNGNKEYADSVVDTHCWIGIPVDRQRAPGAFKQAYRTPGLFNKFATVSGRIEVRDGKAWFMVTHAENLRVKPPLSNAEEDSLFRRSIEEKNSYFEANRRGN